MDMTQGTRFGARALRKWAVLTIVALLCTLGATATQASAQIDNNSDGFTAASAAAAARSELSQYGGQHECNNSGLRNRIGAYWDAGDLNLNLDGCDTGSPWSAVFISFVMDQAGAGPDFNYAISHREYIEAAFDGFGLYNTVRDADNRRPVSATSCAAAAAQPPDGSTATSSTGTTAAAASSPLTATWSPQFLAAT